MTKIEQLKNEMARAWANVEAWDKAKAEAKAKAKAEVEAWAKDRANVEARARTNVEAWVKAWAKYEKAKQAYETELNKESNK